MSYEIIMEAALQILSRRRMTTREITQRLFKKFPNQESNIDRMVARLIEMRYLNDYAYVQAFTRDRMKFRPRGKNILKMELMKKGVEREVIEKGLSEMDVDESTMACVLFEQYKKKSSFRNSKDRKSSLFRYLAGKGISFSAVRTVIAENEVDF